MENINNSFFSNNYNNKRVNVEFCALKAPNYSYTSSFSENRTQKNDVKYKIKRDRKVFDE